MHFKQKLIGNFEKLHCKLNGKKDFKLLDRYVDMFFPSKNYVMQNLRILTPEDKESRFIYNAVYLPFHTRDIEWLINSIKEKIHKTPVMAELDAIPYNTLKAYVETSPVFDARRNRYEQDLVCNYITNWLDSTSGDFFTTKEEKKRIKESRNFDEEFYEKVVCAIASLGINRPLVELYMAQNTGIWQKPVMQQTCLNRLKKDFSKIALKQEERLLLGKYNPDAWNQLVEKELSYISKWMLLRENKHYGQHKKIIDKAGIITPAMKLADYRVYSLRDELTDTRCEYVELLKNSAHIVNDIQKEQGVKGLVR